MDVPRPPALAVLQKPLRTDFFLPWPISDLLQAQIHPLLLALFPHCKGKEAELPACQEGK